MSEPRMNERDGRSGAMDPKEIAEGKALVEAAAEFPAEFSAWQMRADRRNDWLVRNASRLLDAAENNTPTLRGEQRRYVEQARSRVDDSGTPSADLRQALRIMVRILDGHFPPDDLR